jgi:hypothetical protein
LIATLPLIVQGCSCGHDFDFHIQSWLDAAEQFRHGTLLPHWAFSSAFNAGEPRFIFYPPLSWMLGALLSLVFPVAALPAIYTFIALAAAGVAMHRLASHFASPNAALLASVLYVVNPYMLFNAYERTAYAELLAAAWLPLLLLAALRERPTVRGIALPVALLWLTNAPAAVMGCYTLAVIVIVRVAVAFRPRTNVHEETLPARLAVISLAGTALGLALSAFYLVPAAYERRFVQIAMAVIPNMRFQDNFLFGHTGDVEHDAVQHTASLLAVTLLATTMALIVVLWVASRKSEPVTSETKHRAPIAHATMVSLTSLTFLIGFLLTPVSTHLWNHLPELAFLQFPWRLMSILAVVLALAITLLLNVARLKHALAVSLALGLAIPFTVISIHNFRQECDAPDLPVTRAQRFEAHKGIEPTDEYTPNQADNDTLRSDDPPFWLSANPQAFAPGTTPNPLAKPNAPPAPEDAAPSSQGTTPPATAPFVFTLAAPRAEFVILNLRRYPAWRILINGHDAHPYAGAQRDDGLTVVPVDAGISDIAIAWRRTPDENLGIVLSLLAVAIYVGLTLAARSGRINI